MSDLTTVPVMSPPVGNTGSLVFSEALTEVLAARARATSGESLAAAYAFNSAPMGGMKPSGLGRRSGHEGIAKCSELQNIAVQRGMGISNPGGIGQEQFASAMTGALALMKKVGMP